MRTKSISRRYHCALAATVPEHVLATLLRDPHVARGFQARTRENQRRRARDADTVERVKTAAAIPRPSDPKPTSPVLDAELGRRLEAVRRNKR
jgi:hypothetical protein